MTKYGNRRVFDASHGWFDSQAEYDRWSELVNLEQASQIKDLRRQPKYVLSDFPRCVYTPDADYLEWASGDGGGWRLCVEDVKGAVSRDVFVRVCWLLDAHSGVEVVRLLRRAGPKTRVPRGWSLVGGWMVREYRRGPVKRRRRAA